MKRRSRDGLAAKDLLSDWHSENHSDTSSLHFIPRLVAHNLHIHWVRKIIGIVNYGVNHYTIIKLLQKIKQQSQKSTEHCDVFYLKHMTAFLYGIYKSKQQKYPCVLSFLKQ